MSLLVALVLSVSSCYLAPVTAPIIDPFRDPPCPWCPGNRGLELDTVAGEPVRSMAIGRVAFAGVVVGVAYVSVDHPDGRRSTYGRLTSIAVRDGQQVAAGTVVGEAGDTMILTVRVAGRYVDPAPLIGRPTWRARLVPLDGTSPRPAIPGPTRCALDGARAG